MVVKIAGRYHHLGLDFCIITFYDPQRAAIIEALERADLPLECVYNVDSFQGTCHSSCISITCPTGLLILNRRCSGNEADYVILSSVRTKLPGFLNSQPRMNVALTRCCKGMVVVTNKGFLEHAGKGTLLGKLCRTWSRHCDDACWIDRKAMLNNSVALPGLPLSLPPPPALSMSQHRPRPTPVRSSNQRTKMPPRGGPPSSKPQTRTRTQTQTHRASSLSTLARPVVPVGSVSMIESLRLGIQMAAVQRQPVDDTFPSLRELATVLDQPSRRRKPKGRKAN
jgi:hypothetical protein